MWCLKMQDAHLAETEQTLIPIRPQHQQRQRQNQQFEGGGNVDCCVDRKIGWRYFREPRENPLTASSSSTSQWPTSQWQTSWSSRQRTSSEKWWWFWFPDNRRRVYTGHPFTIHICAVQFVHKRRNAHTTSLAQELLCHLCETENKWCHLVWPMSHPWLISHALSSMSTSSSSFTLLYMTQEHAAQSVQQEQLREHPVHHAHLQAPSVDKLLHQKSLWPEDLQSGGNSRITTPTFKTCSLRCAARADSYSHELDVSNEITRYSYIWMICGSIHRDGT